MPQIFSDIAANLTDFLVYAAIAVVTLAGFIKCIFPVMGIGRSLRRGVRLLESSPGKEGARPIWQDSLFLGKRLEGAWRRFLHNAEQLDARGLTCGVEDYINDDTTVYAVGHVQLSEVIPGLLTSLGILGTFIGLMRGLGGLDVSDASKTMESIPDMIGGMTFAFATSIAGIACSLAFNMIGRAVTGSAVKSLDDFREAFSEIVMERPLEDSVQLIIQQEDRAAMLRHAVSDVGSRVSEGITQAVERSIAPVTRSMNNFILGQTQSQIEGVHNITEQFIAKMNQSLGGQFLQLGKSLTQVTQAQGVSFQAIEQALGAAESIMRDLSRIQGVTERVTERFDAFLQTMDSTQRQNDEFLTHGSQVLSGMMTAAQEQSGLITSLTESQMTLKTSMQDYAQWSGRVLSAVKEQSDGALQMSEGLAKGMDNSAKALKDTYADFVESFGAGLSKALGMFDENMHSVVNSLSQKLDQLEKTMQKAPDQAKRYQQETEGYITALARMQQALTDIAKSIEPDKRMPEGA